MRIGFLIGTLNIGGTEKQLVQLCQKLDPEQFSPEIICMIGKGVMAKTLEDEGIPVISFGRPGIRHPIREFSCILRTARYAKTRRYDLLVGTLPHAVVLGALVKKMAGIPAYVSWRRSSEDTQPARVVFSILRKVANQVTDLVIANSQAVKERAIRCEGLRDNDIQVIHNGVDLQRFGRFKKESVRTAMGLDQHHPVVAVLSNFKSYKGHSFFLDAWKEVARSFPRALALLIGGGGIIQQIQTLVQEKSLAGHICFTGSRLDIPELLAAIDILVHPSLEEGFSNAILEAMASGKPVIASAVGGIPEAVIHKQTGLLVQPGNSTELTNALLCLLRDPEKAHSMGVLGRERAFRHFPFSTMVQEYEKTFQRLAHGS